ncbi:unnamed protein product [Linum tenue]|uniref:Uncharacterized protein n=1 Tax=Linum tenue TaxID=586396 RepID=A0AAV0MEG3_9ROSI|nr:unnamed protein product [Linum tenue]
MSDPKNNMSGGSSSGNPPKYTQIYDRRREGAAQCDEHEESGGWGATGRCSGRLTMLTTTGIEIWNRRRRLAMAMIDDGDDDGY